VTFVKVLLVGLVVVFAAYQIYALIRDIKMKKKKPPEDNNKKEDRK
jgi:hypothetical protein